MLVKAYKDNCEPTILSLASVKNINPYNAAEIEIEWQSGVKTLYNRIEIL